MGIGGISIPSLLIILVIVLLLFGTKKLRNLGGDLGGAIKGFKKAVSDDKKTVSDDGKPPSSVEDNSTDDSLTTEADEAINTEKQHSETK